MRNSGPQFLLPRRASMNRKMLLGVCVLALGPLACADGVGDTSESVVGEKVQLLSPAFEVDPSWPTIPNDWVFGITSGLSIDAEGNIWVLHRPRTIPDELAAHAAPPVVPARIQQGARTPARSTFGHHDPPALLMAAAGRLLNSSPRWRRRALPSRARPGTIPTTDRHRSRR